MTHKRKPCESCGGEKLPGKGQKFCAVCRDVRVAETAERASRLRGDPEYQRAQKARREAGDSQRVHRSKWPEGQKWCTRCERFLPIEKFTAYKKGPAPYCPPCSKAYHHERRIKREYGLEPEDYFDLLTSQDGRCAICQSRPRSKRLAVDHDHGTGAVRGLLCSRCNHKLLGGARDDVEILRRAVAYLERPPAGDIEAIATRSEHLRTAFEDALDEGLDDLERRRAESGDPFGVCFARLPGGKWVAAMDLDGFASVYREVSAPLPPKGPWTIEGQEELPI